MAQGTSGAKLFCGNKAASSACAAAASGPPSALRSAASVSSWWRNVLWDWLDECLISSADT